MTEERIKELAEKFWQKNYVNGGCQPIWTAVLGYAHAVAAEAMEEGYCSGLENMQMRSYSKLVQLSFTSGYLDPAMDLVDISDLLKEAQHELEAERLEKQDCGCGIKHKPSCEHFGVAERLKEQGK